MNDILLESTDSIMTYTLPSMINRLVLRRYDDKFMELINPSKESYESLTELVQNSLDRSHNEFIQILLLEEFESYIPETPESISVFFPSADGMDQCEYRSDQIEIGVEKMIFERDLRSLKFYCQFIKSESE